MTSTLDTLPYHLSIDGLPRDHLRVHAFTGREAISEAYAFDIVATLRGVEEIERIALGRRAVFTWDVGRGQRAFYGVLSAVRLAGADPSTGTLKVHLRLVPRLWLLKRKVNTRIFQKQRVPDIVTAVLLEAGISSRWQLKRDYPAREYCTQYEESDYRFIQRILAEAGIYFYFPQGPALPAVAGAVEGVAAFVSLPSPALSAVAGAASLVIPGDTVIGADDAAFYPPIGSDDPGELLAESAAALVPEIGGAIGDVAGAALGAAAGVVAALTARQAPVLYYLSMLETETSPVDKITRFALRTSVRPDHAHFRDYDPERPMAPLRSTASSTEPFPQSSIQAAAAAAGAAVATAIGGGAGAVAGLVAEGAGAAADLLATPGAPSLEVYDHHGSFLFPKWGFTGDEAARILRQKRRRASVATGESGCPALSPGHRFALSDHPASHLDRPYVVTRVEHRGAARPQADGDQRLYACSFTCVPAVVTYVPPRPKRQCVQVALTATVVGPPGEEIHVDAMGQIKVQFHWDRQGTYDDRSSCWIRTMHPWGGAGWGVQFIPRVGMEVVVVFEGGDPDKPMILGALYNGTHPSPFSLPSDKTRSGWRTQSYPGGPGFNELSFEDIQGGEQVYLHAQRDLDEAVLRDHTLRVGHDESIDISGTRRDHVGVDLYTAIDGKRETEIGKDDSLRVEGVRFVRSLDAETTVRRHETSVVGGNARREVTGLADERVKRDKTIRVDGNLTTVVGSHDARRTFVVHAEGRAVVESSDHTEIASEKELVLRCGGSRIRLTPERIELSSDAGLSLRSGNTVVEVTPAEARIRSKGKAVISADSINILTDTAQVKLTDEVKITGSMVKLNPPKTDQEKDDDPKPPPPTKLVFKDKAGRPLANQRFVIHFDDGSEVAGVLDHEGKAELELEGGGAKITFPEASDVNAG